jgi:hypothetical protein
VSRVVQSGLVSEPWKELLETCAGLPHKTQQEVIAGKMALLRHKLEEKKEGWIDMLAWKEFDVKVAGFAGDADAGALFRLQQFTAMNETLAKKMEEWNVKGLRAAAICDNGVTARVKAVLGPDNNVEFAEPIEEFPSETMMTQLLMIAPGEKK